MVVITEEGQDVMYDRRPARLLLPPATPARGAAPTRADRGDAQLKRRAAAESEQTLDPGDFALFEALRVHRLEVARREGVPPYVVASDRTLRDLVALRPKDPEQLLLVYGIGPTKAARYGAGRLEVLQNH